MEKQQTAVMAVAGVAVAVWAIGAYPFITILVLGSLALLFLMIWFSSLIFVDEDDVLSVLSTIEWRSIQQIENELRRIKRAAAWQSVCRVRSRLRDLVVEDLVEEREKDMNTRELAQRGVPREYIYRRKTDGYHSKYRYKKRHGHLIPIAHPI